MFYTMEAEGRVKISLQYEDKEKEVFEELKEKYVGKIIDGFGVCILVIRVTNVCEYKVCDEFLLASVEFEMMLFKFFRDEVMYGEILDQDEDGMRLGVSFFDGLCVRKECLPSVSERMHVNDGGERRITWAWLYKGNRLYFKRSACVRFRVMDADEQSSRVLCSLDETGLGPLEWWV